jgi:hypothetical protein
MAKRRRLSTAEREAIGGIGLTTRIEAARRFLGFIGNETYPVSASISGGAIRATKPDIGVYRAGTRRRSLRHAVID